MSAAIGVHASPTMRIALALFLQSALFAQDAPISARSNLVLVPVVVTDRKGHPIDGLEPHDFTVFDNGRQREFTVDTTATGVAPIALVVAVQSSGISAPVLEKVQKIGSMIPPMVTGEHGCAALVTFDAEVNWLQSCTQDQNQFSKAMGKLKAGEPMRARMLDAASAAIKELEKQPNLRRILFLISESRDRGSDEELNAVTTAAQTAGVPVYAATYSAFRTAFTAKSAQPSPKAAKTPKSASEQNGTISGLPPDKANPKVPSPDQRGDLLAGIGELARLGKTNTTESLAKATGGTQFAFTRQKGLEDAIEKLGSELHQLYVISFIPDASTPGYHRIDVQVAGGKYIVRGRPGYWSGSQSSTP